MMNWESVEPVPDVASAMERLAVRYGLEGKKVNLVLGRDLNSSSFLVPKSRRSDTMRMAVNELTAAGVNVRQSAAAVDMEARRRKGTLAVMAYHMEGCRFDAYKAAMDKAKMVCGRVLVLPDCMALMARALWRESRILLVNAGMEGVGFYALSGGHCLGCRMTALRAGRFIREGADELLYEEMAERAEELLREQSASMEGYMPECIARMTDCLPEPEKAARYLESHLGIPCRVRIPEADEGSDNEPHTDIGSGSSRISAQCLAACVAGSLDRNRKAIELCVQEYPAGRRGFMGLMSSISRGWALFLAANILAASGMSIYTVCLNRQAGRKLTEAEAAVNDPVYKMRSQKAQQMDQRIQELLASGDKKQAVMEAVSRENVLGMDRFRAFTDAMEPGMRIESITYRGEDSTLWMVVSMDYPGKVPDYVNRIQASGRFGEVGHSLWERKSEDRDNGRTYATVYAVAGTGGQNEIQQ